MKKLMISTFFLILHSCFFTSCNDNTINETTSLKSLEKKILKIAQKRNIPSLALQIKTNEGILNIDYNHPNTEKQIIYGIGSTTKFLTAILVFKLIEEEKINLKDNVIDYVNDLTNIKDGNTIQIENLLNHTSGLSDYTMHPTWRETVVNGKGPKDFEKKFSYVNTELKNTGIYAYSNTNYLLLQQIVEAILLKPYDIYFNEFFENHDLKDLKMGYKNEDLQAFYAEDEKSSTNVSNWQENYGFDGGVYTTPIELNRFLQKVFIEKSIIGEKTIAQMKQWISTGSIGMPIGDGHISEYGNGVMKLKYKDKEYIGHAGGTLKYQSFVFYNINNEESISVTTNCSGKYYNNVFFQEIIPLVLDNI